ncbi:MAG: hypothetical protein H7222_15845 [Methylotenera sp.]|nr:hypothetical protein [Oligoflexia bacterium]
MKLQKNHIFAWMTCVTLFALLCGTSDTAHAAATETVESESALDSTLNLFLKMREMATTTLSAPAGTCQNLQEPWPKCLRKLTPQNFIHPETPAILSRAAKRVETRMRASEKRQHLPPGTFQIGAPLYIRTFKHDTLSKFVTGPRTQQAKARLLHQLDEELDGGAMEIWLQTPSGRYELFHTYHICQVRGTPAPKRNEDDLLTPEGFYQAEAPLLNPNSNYHLSFDVGYPNQFDLNHNEHNRTNGAGNEIYIHGICGSVGCFAMTDPLIEEIYSLADASLNQNEVLQDGTVRPYSIPVHSFPFRMTRDNMAQFDSASMAVMEKHFQGAAGSILDLPAFWENLREGYQRFEDAKIPPKVSISGSGVSSKYAFNDGLQIRKRRCPNLSQSRTH